MRCFTSALAAAVCLCAAPLHAQPLGTFTGQVQTLRGPSGLSGEAVACLSDDDPRDMQTFVMLRGQAGIEVMLVLRSPAPQAGEYDLDPYRPGGEMAPMASLDVPRGDGGKYVYRARSGTLRLTAASADRLQGTVEFLGQELQDPNEAMRVGLQFTAERIGGMTEGDCVRPAAGTAPTTSAGAALAGAQVAPGTAALAIRNTQGSIPNTGTVDFCRTEEGLLIGVQVQGGGRLLMDNVPPRPGRFTVGIEDNEVFVSLNTGEGTQSWAAESGFVIITSVTADRVQGSLETDISPIGGGPDAGYVMLAGVFDALVHPRCR
jgi:hypothetical protein